MILECVSRDAGSIPAQVFLDNLPAQSELLFAQLAGRLMAAEASSSVKLRAPTEYLNEYDLILFRVMKPLRAKLYGVP